MRQWKLSFGFSLSCKHFCRCVNLSLNVASVETLSIFYQICKQQERKERKKKVQQQSSPMRVFLYKVIVDVFNPIVVYHDAIFLLLSKNPNRKVPWIASDCKKSERPDNVCYRAKSLQLLHNFIIYNVFVKLRFYFAMICTILIKKALKQSSGSSLKIWHEKIFYSPFASHFSPLTAVFWSAFFPYFFCYCSLIFSAIRSKNFGWWATKEGGREG